MQCFDKKGKPADQPTLAPSQEAQDEFVKYLAKCTTKEAIQKVCLKNHLGTITSKGKGLIALVKHSVGE